MKTIGHVEAIFRYPVKSMAAEPLDEAELGWHGLEGDRRFALRRLEDAGGKPWLTASKLPELLRFTPLRRGADLLPTHVRTPDGREFPITSDELAAEIGGLHGKPVQMMRLEHGIFDEGTVSVITPATIDAIAAASGHALEARRFRPNLLVRTDDPRAFEEDAWVGGVLVFGDDVEVSVTLRDERCAMLNLDPDSARSEPNVLKAAVRLNTNYAGVYGTVIRRGRVAVGQAVQLRGGST